MEPLATDFAWVHLAFEGTTVAATGLANANEGPFIDTTQQNWDHTDWQTLTLDLASQGSYTITLGVMDVQDVFVDSYVFFDAFRLRRSPEPDTALLVGLGLIGLGLRARRARRPRRA